VYMAFASHGDEDPYHGWIIGYNSHDLSQQTGVFNVTPNGMEGGIWQGGHGLASDDSGSIYAISGNGDFDGTRNFGQSFLRLNSAGLALSASFTPDNWLDLDDGDTDIGSSGPVLIRGKNLLLGANKGGVVYVVDAAHMGGLQSGNPQVVQMLQARRGPIFNMALWNGPNGEILYIEGADAGVNAYCMSARTFNPAPCSSNSSVPATAKAGMAISANGNKRGTGILWITTGSGSGATLRAFDATDVSNEIWNSDQSGGPDALGSFAKFATPTIAAGRVYVPTFSGQIVVYGLTSQSNVLGRLTGLKR